MTEKEATMTNGAAHEASSPAEDVPPPPAEDVPPPSAENVPAAVTEDVPPAATEDVPPAAAETVPPPPADDVLPSPADDVLPPQGDDALPPPADDVPPLPADDVLPPPADDVLPPPAEDFPAPPLEDVLPPPQPPSLSSASEAQKPPVDENEILNATFKETIRNEVLEVLNHLNIVKDNDFMPKPDGPWVEAKCPARIDLFGGWTDTPPICYEMGGSVVNMGVLVDGVKPISAKARFNSNHTKIKLLMLEKSGPERLVVVEDMEQLLDYTDPSTEGALLKACIVACNVFDKEKPLKEQLLESYRGGLDIVSVTHLPHGSGLGTSSILASALCAVIWGATGNLFDRKSLLQVVLVVEQLLTTGGGWQDQVGGVLGGINRGFTRPGKPLQVKFEPLPVEDAFVDLIEQHTVLLYTGRVRLAKNILDVVVSRWFDHCPSMMDCFRKLHTGSMQMQGAIKMRDLARVAALFTDYWELKKKLADNSEPPEVTQLIRVVEPYCVGYSLLGAGGGGFLCAITALPGMHDEIRTELKRNSDFDKVTVHRITLDTTGIQLYRGTSIIHI